MRFLIITGMSGAGKSTASKCLEDLGYYCVDNLPLTLLPKFAELCAQSPTLIHKAALVIDIREGHFLSQFHEIVEPMQKEGHELEIIFLDAADEVLVRRFSETRRPHPLDQRGPVINGIQKERQLLGELRQQADRIIDTSNFTVHDFKRMMGQYYSQTKTHTELALISFGYKFGLPYDADLVFDLRFLPNPHFIEELRPLTGLDEGVKNFVLNRPETQSFLYHLKNFLHYALPLYVQEGRAYLSIALGCTGGVHRSVALVDYLSQELMKENYEITVRHRDLDKRT
jgi:UPF0042 nucleotide-binding protein